MLRPRGTDEEGQGDTNEKTFLHALCDKHLTKELADLVKAQSNLALSYNNKKATNKFCWELYHTSPEAYKLLQKAMCLPDPDTLFKDLKVTTDMNDKVISALKTKAEVMKDEEKNCSLILGAMTLEPNMFFSIKEDLIIGFEDINGTRTPEIAEHALVIMLRGLNSDWKHIIGYAFVSEYCEAVDKWIDQVLEKLFEIGFKVRTLITNMEPELLYVAKNGAVTTERPYFHVNNKKIYYIYDAPSLMKMLQDDLKKHDIHFNGKVVKYQQFSNATSGVTVVDFEAIESGSYSAEFIKKIKDLFNMLISTAKDNSKPFCGEESQVAYLNEMVQFFQELKLIDKDTGKEATDVLFIKGISTTIASIMLLYEDLKIQTDLTERLNKEPLDNVFEQIRKMTGSEEPTCRKFKSAYHKLFITYLMRDGKSDSKDLESITADASEIDLDDSNDSDDSFKELFETLDALENGDDDDENGDDDSDEWEDI